MPGTRFTLSGRSAIADALDDAIGESGVMKMYAGPRPVDVEDDSSGNLLLSFTFQTPAFGDASDGVIAANLPVASDETSASGILSHGVIETAAGEKIMDFRLPNNFLDSPEISPLMIVRLQAFTISAPRSCGDPGGDEFDPLVVSNYDEPRYTIYGRNQLANGLSSAIGAGGTMEWWTEDAYDSDTPETDPPESGDKVLEFTFLDPPFAPAVGGAISPYGPLTTNGLAVGFTSWAAVRDSSGTKLFDFQYETLTLTDISVTVGKEISVRQLSFVFREYCPSAVGAATTVFWD